MEILSPAELEGVLAHELAHHVYRDSWSAILVEMVFIATAAVASSKVQFVLGDPQDYKGPEIRYAAGAEALVQALGLPGGNEDWKAPFPTAEAQSRSQWWAEELRWGRRHLLPWLWQGLLGRSSSHGRGPKRPILGPP